MSKIRTYTIGRDPTASVVLPHDTVSRVHAELIPVAGGQVYVTDCASTSGTFIDEGGRWQKITQTFVNAGAKLRFGKLEVGVDQLLADIARLSAGSGEGSSAAAGNESAPTPEKSKPLDASQGVMRDPETGEPIALDSDWFGLG